MSRRWVLRGALALAAAAGFAGFVVVEHGRPLLVPLLLLVVAVTSLLGLLLDSAGVDPAAWSLSDMAAPIAGEGQDAALAANLRMLENHVNARQVGSTLKDRLGVLTGRRLALLGLSMDDPAVVERLGPTLVGVLTGPPRTLRITELEECVRRIQGLGA